MKDQLPDLKRKRFLRGAALVWVPFLFLATPTAIGLYRSFRPILQEKATGLAVVTGGFTEMFSTFGLFALLVFEITAIILLLRSFSGDNPQRTVLSALSICCSGFMLALAGVFVWLTFFLHQ